MGRESTYEFRKFQDAEGELARLELQASFATSLERTHWHRAGLASGMRVLDAGCGPGFISRELGAFIESGEVTGVDVDAALLDIARKRAFNSPNVALRFVEASLYELPLADASFDFAYARLVLQHLSEPRAALAELHRVLAPGGAICITDIDDRWLTLFPDDETVSRMFAASTRAQNGRGGDRFIGTKLASLLGDAGFEAVTPSVTLLSNHNVPFRALFDVAIRARSAYIAADPGPPDVAELEAAYERLVARNAWIHCGVFNVVARKPR